MREVNESPTVARKCDRCPRQAVRGRVVWKTVIGPHEGSKRRVPDYAEFACAEHADFSRGGTLWGNVEHAAEWEASDAPEPGR